VQTSREFEDVLMGGIPAWIPQLILPLGFGLICYRYCFFVGKGVAKFAIGETES